MMLTDQEPRYRSRTHELGPFWKAMGVCCHDRWDAELRAVEWAAVTPVVVGALLRAGFTCIRQVEAAPDWVLRTVPGLGPVGIRQLRLVVPHRRDIFRRERCPAYALERDRFNATFDSDREHLALLLREVHMAQAVEDGLYGRATHGGSTTHG